MGGGQILPSAQQQPPLPPDEPPLLWSLPEELRLSHLIDRIIGVLQDMELVVHDLALRHPLFNAFAEWLPHVHTRRLNSFPLPAVQLGTEELVQRLLLSLPAEPQRLPVSRLQTTVRNLSFFLL